MCTFDYFQELSKRIEALGLGHGLAEECAARIGDTPFMVDGDIWVTGRWGAVLAVIPERLLFPERAVPWPWKGAPDVILMRGKVDTGAEHVAVCAGRQVLGRLAPKDPGKPEAGRFLLEWRVPPNFRKTPEWTKATQGEISGMLTGKGEQSPWGYLLSHCGTTGNVRACLNGGTYFSRRPGTRKTPE